MSAKVCEIVSIEPHPDADRLEIILVTGPGVVEKIVVGKHYKVGQLGVYIVAGQLIPNWLAKDLWMVGKGNSEDLIPVVIKNMRGIQSPGIFCGQTFQNDRDSPWQTWSHWQPDWKLGDDVSEALGVR